MDTQIPMGPGAFVGVTRLAGSPPTDHESSTVLLDDALESPVVHSRTQMGHVGTVNIAKDGRIIDFAVHRTTFDNHRPDHPRTVSTDDIRMAVQRLFDEVPEGGALTTSAGDTSIIVRDLKGVVHRWRAPARTMPDAMHAVSFLVRGLH